MQTLRQIEKDILTTGKVDGRELAQLPQLWGEIQEFPVFVRYPPQKLALHFLDLMHSGRQSETLRQLQSQVAEQDGLGLVRMDHTA
jgi:hypothetical protein